MVKTPLINLVEAQLSVAEDGTVTIDDPGSPVVMKVKAEGTHISRIEITIRNSNSQINASSISRIPMAEIKRLAIAARSPVTQETWVTISAALKPVGTRSWDSDHWERVKAVAEWAETTNRPGGKYQAVADFWGVSRNPTAGRWLRRATKQNVRDDRKPDA